MGYFFIKKKDINDDILTIKGSEFRHLKSVLRSRNGERIIVITGDGEEYHSVISKIGTDYIRARIAKVTRKTNEPLIYVSIAISPPKGKRMDWFVEKATEIGVREIVPVVTKRSVVIPEVAKTARWKKIAISAVKQSERSILPEIRDTVRFDDFLYMCQDFTLKFIAYENERNNTIEKYMGENEARKILVFIGPEGGFEDWEVDAVSKQGFLSVTLGTVKLRTETAGIVALSRILSRGY